MKSVIKNYYGLDYEIFENGEIFGLKRGKISQRKNKDGYMEVTLGTSENRHSRVKVHRVIADAFIPNPNNLPEVNHKDYDRSNNRSENLEWCSHLDNIKYSSTKGRFKNTKSGENNGRSKLTTSIVSKIREEYNNNTKISVLSKKYGIPYSTIFNIVHNKTWKNL